MLYSSPIITVYAIALTCLIGLAAGSFLNCAAMRAVSGESIARGRSHCPQCNHTLGVLDLVPLFSWLFLWGRCRYCGAKISWRYPLSELLTALVFVSALLKWDISLKALEMALLGSVLLWISFTDAEAQIIPNRLIVAGIAIRVVFILISGDIPHVALQSAIGGLSVSLPVLLIALLLEKLLKREAVGGGDIKLLFMTGLYFDWKLNVLALLLACFAGIAFALISRVKSGKPFPFGPAIACGTWLSMLFGNAVISAYLGLFGL
jgi:leader peptidase (prepilin peptidase)/N-methyltransferase